MRMFVLRPVMAGLLALILAGMWGVPLGKRSGGDPLMARAACPAAAAALLHQGGHC
jgi:hypothetical protein